MHPRTVAIIAVALLVGAFVLRLLVVRFGLLPVSDEVVLKKAVAITVHYFDRGKKEVLVITNPGEVSALLATLRIKGNGYSWVAQPQDLDPTPYIVFHFPRGQASLPLVSPRSLGGNKIDEAFYTQLNEVISLRRGRPVDILRGPSGADWSKQP
jgi:hypothetical protein